MIYITLAIFQPNYDFEAGDITNLLNGSGETGNLTQDLLLHKPRA